VFNQFGFYMALKDTPTIAAKSILQLEMVTFFDQKNMKWKKRNVTYHVHTQNKKSYIRDIREGGIL